jgi:hypothetical protein
MVFALTFPFTWFLFLVFLRQPYTSGISSRFGLNSPSLEEFLNVCGGLLEAAVGQRDIKILNKNQFFFRLEAEFFVSCLRVLC